jgi:hypothetical protein
MEFPLTLPLAERFELGEWSNEYDGWTLRGAASGLEVRVRGEQVEVLEMEDMLLGEMERMERVGEKAVLRRRREWVGRRGAKRLGRVSENMVIDVYVVVGVVEGYVVLS